MLQSELSSEESKGSDRVRLNGHLKLVAPPAVASLAVTSLAERRRKLRMKCSYPARARIYAATVATFETEGVLDNLSACGMRLRLRARVPGDTRLFILVQFAPPAQSKNTRLVQGIAVRGVVRRLELLPAGLCALGVEFSRYRFIDIPNEQAALLRSLRHPWFD